MEIEHCAFPDDLLFDADGLTWTRFVDRTEAVVGISSIQAAVAGLPDRVTAKQPGHAYARGAAIGFLESGRFFGPIRTPVSGILTTVNELVLERPRLLAQRPYAEGWFARIRPTDLEIDRPSLRTAPEAAAFLAAQISALHVRCFAAVPDHELFEIGVECAVVLVRLNDLLRAIEADQVVHLVTDDPTAPVEMVRWSDESGQPVIDERREGNLFHFLVRKVR